LRSKGLGHTMSGRGAIRQGFYTITSPTSYLTGAVGGGFPPLGQHIRGEMGGYWYPPVKVLGGFECTVDSVKVEEGVLQGFRYGYTWVTHLFKLPGFSVKRHVSLRGNTLEVRYTCGDCGRPLTLSLYTSRVASWNTDLSFGLTLRNRGGTVHLNWRANSVSVEGRVSPVRGRLVSAGGGRLVYKGIGEVCVELEVRRPPPRMERIEDHYSTCTSHPKIYGDVYSRAMRNLLSLARADPLGVYFSAGHPEFPWLFGVDTCYVVEQTRFAGFGWLRGAALRSLLSNRDSRVGLIPHEVTHGGEIYNPGDLEETPFFIKLYLEYALDSGDLHSLGEAYETCATLMGFLERYDKDGDLVAEGPGIVEGQGRERGAKIDVACYTALAYRAMAKAAQLLGRPEYEQWVKASDTIIEEVNTGYWSNKTHTYRQLKIEGEYVDTGDWTHVIPFATGIAPPERGGDLSRLAREPYSGRYGLYLKKNTGTPKPGAKGGGPPSMPIGTGLLASSLFRYGRMDDGWRVVDKLVSIYGLSGPGYLAEIAPNLGCHTQAWSYSAYASSLIEAALKPSYDGSTNTLTIDPPREAKINLWFRGLTFGKNRVDFRLDGERCQVKVTAGRITLRRGERGERFELNEVGGLELPI